VKKFPLRRMPICLLCEKPQPVRYCIWIEGKPLCNVCAGKVVSIAYGKVFGDNDEET